MKVVIGTTIGAVLLLGAYAAQSAQAQGWGMARAETGAVMSHGMALMSGGIALGCIAKPAIYASGLIASGTRLSVCVPKAVCARFKIDRPAPAAADSAGL